MTGEALRGARVDIAGSLMAPGDTLRAAMERMTQTNVAIVLVADAQRRLVGVVVDGDIRRALLANGDLAQPVSAIMTRQPRTAPFDIAEDDLRALANQALSTWLPLVDKDGTLRGLVDLVRLRQQGQRIANAAAIMAGGKGERLWPHTASVPKPMVEVGGRPMLETLLRVLHGHGFERFYISVNYLADRIESHFGDGAALGVSIEYIREKQPMGTAGCLRALAGRETAPVLVVNGDVLTRFNPRAMLDFHRNERGDATLAVREYPLQVPFGVVEADGARLVALREKPVHLFKISAGIYAIEPEALSLIPAGTRFDMPDLIEALTRRRAGSVACFPITDYWLDVGRSEDLERARADFDRHF